MNAEPETKPKKRSHVYGPVPSRRLGRSLGLDLVPFKTCTYDCVYCQLGRTTDKTRQRREYVSIDDVVNELEGALKAGAEPDVVTLSGSGEPTLHSRFGEIIAQAKRLARCPVCVLTNGSLLWDPEVADPCRQADLVLPSLDAAAPGSFEEVNRPHPQITFEEMVEGLVAFGKGFDGEIWLEVMLVHSLNDQPEHLAELRKIIDRMQPGRVHLNTVVRTPAEDFARPVEGARMEAAAAEIGHRAEVAADTKQRDRPRGSREGTAGILALLARRPCSVDDIASGVGMHRNLVVKLIEGLLHDEKITADRAGPEPLYRVVRP